MAGKTRGRVLVVGGGAAGVAAAARLAAADVPVVVLEAGKRLGGRAASGTLPGLGEVDLGFHVTMRTCSSTRKLLALLGAESAVRFQPRIAVPLWRSGTVHWVKSVPFLHLVPAVLTYGHLPSKERLGLLRLLRGIWHVPRDLSAREWLLSLGISGQALENLLRPLILAALNSEPEDAAASYAALVVRRALFSPRGGALGFFQQPLSRIWERAVPLIERAGGEVLTGTKAEKIIVERGQAVGVVLASGKELAGEAVIATPPPDVLADLLPAGAAALPGDELRWSPIVCLHLLFDRPVLELPFLFSLEPPLQAVFSVTKLTGAKSTGEHLALVQSAAGRWLPTKPEELVEEFLPALGRLAPKAKSARLIAAYALKFPRATFVPAPGVDAHRPSPATKVKDLFLAGDFVRTGWPATIEGAVRSGFAAATLAARVS